MDNTVKQYKAIGAKNSNPYCTDETAYIECIMTRIVEKQVDIAPTYDEWINLCFALASLGEQGRSIYHTLSRLHGDYSADYTDDKFTNCLQNSQNAVSIATFIQMAKDHGIDVSVPEELKPRRGRPRKDEDSAEKENQMLLAEKNLHKYAEFRYNEVTENIEYRERDTNGNPFGNWQPFNDRTFNTYYARIKKSGVKVNPKDVEACIYSFDFAKNYNPIKEYFDSLPEWDQRTDWIEQLFDYFEFESEEERAFCMPYLKMWYILMVALWLGKVKDNQIMPVLVGPQHIGKTFFCKILLPMMLRTLFHVILPRQKMDKDQLLSMSEFLLIEFDEFELTRAIVNLMKAIVTSSGSETRRQWDKFKKVRNRLASFIGTCNEQRFLVNDDGDRRYLAVRVVGSKNIKDYPLPYEGAYAQAYWIVMHRDPDTYSPSHDDSMLIHEHNKDFVSPDICETLLETYYRAPEKGEICTYVTMRDIMLQISWNHNPQINETNIGKALQKMGIEKKRTSRGMRYLVVELCQTAEEEYNRKQALIDNGVDNEDDPF